MPEPTHPIIVTGSSAGGWEALPVILENLPADLPASVFLVQHLSSESMGEAFLRHLANRSVLPCGFAVNQEPIQPGRVYLAPPDFHLLLTPHQMLLTKGPRENSFRPSVDTLFRSAAANFGASVIGVILSGMRDDGVEGMTAIARSGGLTVVQNPADAPYPEMPQAVLNHMSVDYTVSTIDMGLVLADLVYHPLKENTAVPPDVSLEANIAQRVLTSIDALEQVANPTPFNCPTCNGVLWDINHGNQLHSFRCNVGHAFSQERVLQLKSVQIEETLWACLRLLEERKRMFSQFGPGKEGRVLSVGSQKRIAENQLYIDRLRLMLLGDNPGESGEA